MCLLRMETPPLRMGDMPFADGNATFVDRDVLFANGNADFAGGMCLLRMETPLRGRSGGHTGAAPTISPMAPCPKVAGEVLADGQNEKCMPANSSPTDKIENDCRRIVRRRTNTRNVCRRGARRWTNTRDVCRRIVRRWTKREKVAGE